MRSDDLVTLSAVEQRRLIGCKAISPVDLMRACIARMEALNPGVNALAATDFERALDAARAAEAQVMRGEPLPLLHGLPLGVKDLQDTAGLLTTYGNVGRRDFVPQADIGLVARLRRAGAIVTAKTNVPDLGAGANTRNPVWGATGNPFNPRLNAGGSSGGSLRIPAALCGVVALRPSPGMVANTARPLGWSGLSVLGPMGRDVGDTALLMAASVGFDARDPLSASVAPDPFLRLPPVDLSTLRIGFSEDFGLCAVDAGIRRVFRRRMQVLSRMVSRCEPWQPALPDADRAFDILRAESFIAAYADTYRSAPETLGPNVRANVELAASITLADRAWAHLEQTRLSRRFTEAFEQYDLLVAPVTPMSPFPWTELYATTVDGQPMRNYYQWLALTYIVTLGTQPALSLPCGCDEEGMPFGLQLIGPLNGDAALLATARALEQAFAPDTTLRRPLPDIGALRRPHPELRSLVTHPPGSGASPTTASGVNAV